MCVWPPINRCFAILLICVVSAVLPPLAGKVVAGDPQATGDILIVRTDTRLDPTKKYGQIRIESSDVTLDGAGAWLVGVSDGEPKSYRHTALALEGVSNVVIRNVRAKGWETGLHLRDCKAVLVEDCDFSDNFHDPAFGWGENGRRGGVLLERVSNSIIRRTQAHRVWDACVLVDSDRNLLESNDFSHTSNTCLKLWNSSHNVIRDNNLSYGLRIDPGEVHARDSTCVLIESGSNDNRLERNDCTHGGDGIFVRVLNQWVSTGNLFLENDCSYANNNCVEAWSPRNTWIRNKANHGSYGFWLGASDQNTLIGNEASYNGLHTGFHNSPHLPGEMHAGIVFMFGPSSHTLLQGNRCEGNHGAGIAAIGDLESRGGRWNAFHWVAQQNELIKNRWGIYLQHAEMIDLRANRYDQNEIADVWNAENVNEFVRKADPEQGTQTASEPPQVDLQGPTVVRVGEATTWSAEGSRDKDDRPLQYRWRIQSADQGSESRFVATLRKPGFYRLALTIDNGQLANLAWRDLYAVELVDEMGTEGGPEVAGQWSCVEADSKGAFAIDNQVKLVGEGSMSARVDPYSGGRVTLRYRVPGTGLSLAGNSHLTLWLKTRNENVPGWQDVNPLIGLTDTAGETRKLTPVRDLLSAPIANESREGWSYFTIPVDGNAEWKAEGPIGEKIAVIECGFDSWGAPPLKIWIDGLGFRSVDGDE